MTQWYILIDANIRVLCVLSFLEPFTARNAALRKIKYKIANHTLLHLSSLILSYPLLILLAKQAQQSTTTVSSKHSHHHPYHKVSQVVAHHLSFLSSFL